MKKRKEQRRKERKKGKQIIYDGFFIAGVSLTSELFRGCI